MFQIPNLMSIFASYLLLIRSSLAASASVNFCSSRITDWFSADTSSSCQAKEVFLAEEPRLRTQATSDHMIYCTYIVLIEVFVHQPIVGWVVAGLDIWAVASLFQPRLSNLPSSGFKTQKERKKDSTASNSIGNILLRQFLRDKIKTLSGPCLAFLD